MSSTSDERFARVEALVTEIGAALGRGEFPEHPLAEFRFLWQTIPDQEKDGLSYSLKEIEEVVKSLRREQGSQKVRRIPVTTGVPRAPNSADCE